MLQQTSPGGGLSASANNFNLVHTLFDFGDLDTTQQLALRICVSEFRSAGRRVASELFAMTSQLAVMQEILGPRFMDFAVAELGLNSRTVYRYLHSHAVLKAHFSSGELINVGEASNFTQNALALLSPSTDELVISELKLLAQEGKKIDEKIVRQVFERQEESQAGLLASAQAELAMTSKSLDRERQLREAEQGRTGRELANNAELLRRSEQTRDALIAEIEVLKQKETIVTTQTVEVEIVPKGYSTAEEAVKAKTDELNKLNDQIRLTTKSLDESAEKKRVLDEKLAELSAGAEEFLQLKSQLDSLMVKFPIAMMKAMSSSDKTIKSAIKGLGQTMVCFGNQLTSATAA